MSESGPGGGGTLRKGGVGQRGALAAIQKAAERVRFGCGARRDGGRCGGPARPGGRLGLAADPAISLRVQDACLGRPKRRPRHSEVGGGLSKGPGQGRAPVVHSAGPRFEALPKAAATAALSRAEARVRAHKTAH